MEASRLIDALKGAYEKQTIGDGECVVFSDSVSGELKNSLLGLQRELGVGFDISYEIIYRAIGEIVDMETYEVLRGNFDQPECASFYTAERLSYLTIHNQSEIAETVRELDCDIADACAYWYDSMVLRAMESLAGFINDETEEGEDE